MWARVRVQPAGLARVVGMIWRLRVAKVVGNLEREGGG